VPGPERPGWLFLVAGGLIYAGALRTVPVDVGPDRRGWPAARREAVLTALLSAAPNTIVVDIDMEAGTALVHQLAGAAQPDAQPDAPPDTGPDAHPAPPG
jgi:hypothetical protein